MSTDAGVHVSAEAVASLAKLVYSQRYDNPKATPSFHHTLWELCCSENRYVAIAAPRGSAKSTAVTHAYLLSTLLFRERKYALLISDTEEQAAEFVQEITAELDENPEIEKLFGGYKVIKRTGTDLIVRMNDGHKFRVIGKGAEQKVRGRKWQQSRPDIVVLDDVENLELTESDTRRKKLKSWFAKDVLPVGSDDCVFRMVGTILHEDSLLESYMPKEGSKTMHRTPLMDWDYSSLWKSVKFRAHPSEDDFSELLWPEKLTEEGLRASRDDLEKRGDPDSYASEMLNIPILESSSQFRRGDFIPIDGPDWDMNVEYFASGDLAISKEDYAAYTVIAVAGLDEKRYLQVRDIRRDRWDPDQILEEMFSVVQRYGVKDFFLESENIAKALGTQIYDRMRRTGIYFNLISVTPSKDKVKRASALRTMMRSGSVKFNKDAEWYPGLQREMLTFPRGMWKDQVDALALIAQGINYLVDPLTSEEIQEEEYEDDLYEFGFTGANAVTGY